MINKEDAKQRIRGLLEKYNEVVKEGRFRKYTEEETKKDFIRPMFHALGWDTEDSREVSAEEKISKKKVDYGFRINGIPKFFLEAKPLKADLDDPEFAEQAINYAWHKGCTWAVLSDFDQGVKIFNAEWKTADLFQSHFKTIPRQEFLDRFEELWSLSKEGFEQGLLDREAEKYGKKSKKTPVSEQLLNDLTKWRAEFSKDILWRNRGKHLTEEEVDEAVQRIIDRLIFIRNCEDRELEPITLLSTMREWGSKLKGTLAECIVKVFSHFDKEYNSRLFQHHLCDDLDVSNQVLEEVIKGLYHTEDRTIRYDFSALDADVLGNVYEQYLGHILKKTAKRVTLTKKNARRKEQGIYYTPTYIVDYIVRNTLGELLKGKKVDVEKIRVLDPACGSGSFLIKAFDVLNESYIQVGRVYDQTQLDLETYLPFKKKEKILLNNIFGVDLDPKAVEIAQLNLLLKIAEKKQVLPLLQKNIKCGNSVIEDEKVAKDRAFKWKKEFKQIMEDEDGFDIVIGNPPYVRVDNLRVEDKEYWSVAFDSPEGKYDLYYLFIESAFRWLKDGGKCGLIVPNKWCAASSAKKLREIIFNSSASCEIISVSNLDVFKDAANYPLILILTKGKNLKKITVSSAFRREDFLSRNFMSYSLTKQDLLSLPSKIIPINIDQKQFGLVIKLLKNCEKLREYLKISEGLRIPQEFETEKVDKFEIVKQYQFDRYSGIERGSHISGDKLRKVTSFESERYKNSQKDKVLIAEDALQLTCTLDEKKRIPQGGVYFGVLLNDNVSLKYITSLLNSKLLSFVYKTLFGGMHMGGGYLRYRTEFLEQLPVKEVSKGKQNQFEDGVDKIIFLNKRLDELGDKRTDKRQRIEEEVKKTDAEIDEAVYELYGLTESEKKIIESG